jgi:hypothetical protein
MRPGWAGHERVLAMLRTPYTVHSHRDAHCPRLHIFVESDDRIFIASRGEIKLTPKASADPKHLIGQSVRLMPKVK